MSELNAAGGNEEEKKVEAQGEAAGESHAEAQAEVVKPLKGVAAKLAKLVPGKDCGIEDHEKTIGVAMKTILGHESSGYVTGAYYLIGVSLRTIESEGLYGKGITFSKWCLDRGINATRRSHARGIIDFYATFEAAAAVPLPKAIRAYKAGVKGRSGTEISLAGKFKKNLEVVKRSLDKLRNDMEALSDGELQPISNLILQFAEEAGRLAERVRSDNTRFVSDLDRLATDESEDEDEDDDLDGDTEMPIE
jgi:hypothetical protein